MQGNSSQLRLTTWVFPLTQVLMSRIVAIFFHIFPFSACLNQLVESVGLPDDDMDSASTSLPPQTELQQRTVSQQRTTSHLLRFLCLLNLCSLTTDTRLCFYKLNWWSSLATEENLGTGVSCAYALRESESLTKGYRLRLRFLNPPTVASLSYFRQKMSSWCVDECNTGTYFLIL